MITMFMQGGVKDKFDRDADLMENQTSVMKRLVLMAMLSIPTMLLAEPIYHAIAHKEKNPKVDDDDY